jgi:hypothetical protein
MKNKNLRRKSFGLPHVRSSTELLTNGSDLRRKFRDILGQSHL